MWMNSEAHFTSTLLHSVSSRNHLEPPLPPTPLKYFVFSSCVASCFRIQSQTKKPKNKILSVGLDLIGLLQKHFNSSDLILLWWHPEAVGGTVGTTNLSNRYNRKDISCRKHLLSFEIFSLVSSGVCSQSLQLGGDGPQREQEGAGGGRSRTKQRKVKKKRELCVSGESWKSPKVSRRN